ncbi:DUF2723 domain-containing protein, partial [bacterium]|nr:DUF2723 domain-containing protein [bacterium]
AGAVAGLALAFSYSLWMQATNAEVYAPNALLTAMLLWFVVGDARSAGAGHPLPDGRGSVHARGSDRARGSGRARGSDRARGVPLNPQSSILNPRSIYLACAVFGLSFGVHPMTAAMAPLMLYAAWRYKSGGGAWREIGIGASIVATCALVPFFVLPLIALTDPYLVMGDVLSVKGFFKHVTMGTFVGNEKNFAFLASRVASVGHEAYLQFFPAGLALALFGLWAARGRRDVVIPLLLAMLPITLLSAVYVKGGEYDMWLIAAWVPMAVTIGLGADACVRSILKEETRSGGANHPLPDGRGTGGRGSVRRNAIAAFCGAVILAPQLYVNAPLLDRRDDVLPLDYGRNLLSSVGEGGLFVVRGDSACSIVAYVQAVAGERPDVTPVWEPFISFAWYRRYLERRHGVTVPPLDRDLTLTDAVVSLVEVARKGGRELVFTTIPRVTPARPIMFVPSGTLFRVVESRDAPVDLSRWNYRYTDPDWRTRPARPHGQVVERDTGGRATGVTRQLYRQDAIDFQAQAHINLGNYFFSRQAFAKAAEEFEQVLDLIPGDPGMMTRLAESLYLSGDPRAATALHQALAANPGYAPAHLYLAEIARAQGDIETARKEYELARRTGPQLAKVVSERLATLE